MRIIQSAALGIMLASTSGAAAQSFNIDFGTPRSTPSPSYAAAGLAGPWNTIGVPTPGVFYPLVDVQGLSAGATLNNIGGTALLNVDDAGTVGDHQALLDDMLIGFNNPLDVCIWVNNIPNGEYEVLIYALTPGAPSIISRTRVDFADQGPAFIGGAWTGNHEIGTTFSRHTVTITNNRIGLHSGLISSVVQSGINGIQVRRLLPGDCSGDGHVDVTDLLAVIGAWGPCPAAPSLCAADLTGDGTVNVSDLLEVIANWG